MRIEQVSFKEQYILIGMSDNKMTKIFFKDLSKYKDLYKNKQIAKLISLIAH